MITAGFISKTDSDFQHHCRVALEPVVMRSDEMGEFLVVAARGLYT
jgi:hypothetical protein